MRHRSRAELPPSPVEFAYPVAIPDGAVHGAVVLREIPHNFSLQVFQALRMTYAWAAGPEASGIEFDCTDLSGWEAEVLQTKDVDEALWAPVAVIVSELARPAELNVERLSHACLVAMDWALTQHAYGTALLFAEAAAVVWPNNARLAWICGKVPRERQDFTRAETWLKRAKRVAVWTGDWELQAQAINSLGVLKVRLGDLDSGRELLESAARLAKRKRLRERLAKALHDLLDVSIYAGNLEAAETYAAQAFTAYGDTHPNVINLAFDVAHLWMQRGQFARALAVLKALQVHLTDDDRQLRVLASAARAAGAVGDADTFHAAWSKGWKLIDGGTVSHLLAAAPLELGLGALSLGLWEHADLALVTSRDAAKALREADTLVRAESSLDHLARRQAADSYARAGRAYRPIAGDLAIDLVRSLNAQSAGSSGAVDGEITDARS